MNLNLYQVLEMTVAWYCVLLKVEYFHCLLTGGVLLTGSLFNFSLTEIWLLTESSAWLGLCSQPEVSAISGYKEEGNNGSFRW